VSHAPITSLHSPHVERVKALLGPRGKKLRALESTFVADGIQSLRSALSSETDSAPRIRTLYLTEDGLTRLLRDFTTEQIHAHEVIMVSDQVMNAMADTETPQGILALCRYLPLELAKIDERISKPLQKVAFFWQLQDPGNAGTAIRTADACGFDLVIFSDQSVDIYSPKVVRSTAGSLWNIPVVTGVSLSDLEEFAATRELGLVAFDGAAENNFTAIDKSQPNVVVFGNEGRGLPELSASFRAVHIPMKGSAESFNVASAAAIAMYFLSTDSDFQ